MDPNSDFRFIRMQTKKMFDPDPEKNPDPKHWNKLKSPNLESCCGFSQISPSPYTGVGTDLFLCPLQAHDAYMEHCLKAYMYVRKCMSTRICICSHMHVCVHVYMHRLYVSMFLYTRICICVSARI